jgi:type IV pilus secretin PilQ/predicted competence protein
MTSKRRIFVKWAFLVAAICLAVEPCEAVEPGPGSGQAPNSLGEGITCTDGRLTINVDDIEVAELLRMLSVKRRVSIAAGPGVSGNISVNLYDVTFEEALRSILDVSGCTATYRGDVILVTEASEKGRLPLDAADMEVRVFKLDFADPDDAYQLVGEFISPAGKAIISSTESMLLVQDTEPYLGRIRSLLDQIDVPPKQVLIEARLLEITHTDDLTIGVQLDGIKINGETIFRALTSGLAADFRAVAGDFTTAVEPGTGLFAGVLTDDTAAFIEALAQEGNVKTLANPKILAVDKQEAEIIIGDKLGYRITTTTQTSSLESVEFLDVGTQLLLTPRISDDGLVLMEIHPEVSDGSIDAQGLPSESTAEATTHMLVRDGQTIVLGGLIQERTIDHVTKVPLLGDIPWLGHLFRRTTKSKTFSELVVLITPHIVGPEPDERMEKSFRRAEKTFDIEVQRSGDKRESQFEDARVLPLEPARPAQTMEPSQPEVVARTAAERTEVAVSQDDAPSEEIVKAQSEHSKEAFASLGVAVGEFFRALERDETAFASDPEPSQPAVEQVAAEPVEAMASQDEVPAGEPAVARDGYTIQVFASRSAGITGDYVRKLQEEGFLAWVSSPDRPVGDEWYRAMIGRFSTRSEAKESLRDIKQRKELADAFIRQDGESAALRNDQYTMCVETKPEFVQAKVLGDLGIADGRDSR